jgi:hypothetical protein
MLELDVLIIPRSNQIRSLHSRLDLSPIQIGLRKPIKFFRTDVRATRQLVCKVRPDFTSRYAIELGIVKTDVDPRVKGEIHHLDAVGGKNHDAFEVLEVAKED